MTWAQTGLALCFLASVAVVGLRVLGVQTHFAPLWALIRATVQLGALSFILQGAVTHMRWAAAWIVVMMTVAIWTAGRRIHARGPWEWAAVGAGIPAGIMVSLILVFTTGALSSSPEHVLAYGGIISGNAMMVATLAGRGLRDRVRGSWGEVEGWTALGASPRQATRRFRSMAASAALLPHIDQARTTGLVTLPGAFVGALFGGAEPLEAGRFQLLVLGGIMATGVVTAIVVLGMLGSRLDSLAANEGTKDGSGDRR